MTRSRPPFRGMPITDADPPLQPLAQSVLMERYANSGEHSADDIRRRVAAALAAPEPPEVRADFEIAFREAQMRGLIPGGRINAHAGSRDVATLINCFVQPSRVGSEGAGLDEALRLALTTLQAGGGVGYDFSVYPAAGSAGDIGPVGAMQRFDLACANLAAINCRRCAQMAVVRHDHPDVLAFIHAKDGGGLTHFNTSLAVDDAFMKAAIAAPGEHPWQQRVWRELLLAAFDHGEPGVLFLDRINRDNNLGWCERIGASNPCGEQPLPLFGACDLGSLNLCRFVRHPFSEEAQFDFRTFGTVATVAVRMLDNVLDLTFWPLEAQRREALSKRRIGLGFTGLADALVMLGLEFDSEAARRFAARVARCLRNRAYVASVRLARERGAFPLFDAIHYGGEAGFASRLPRRLRALIRRYGIRNSHLLAIAPTGTISLAFGNNISNGIEPIFAARYQRRKRHADGSFATFEVEDFAALLYRHLGRGTKLPPNFVTAQTLSPRSHVEMVAAVAPYIDAGISKTVNLPPSISFEEFAGTFELAWRMGLKGITVFRSGVAGAVMSIV